MPFTYNPFTNRLDYYQAAVPIPGTAVEAVVTDSGTVIPVANSMNLLGSGSITTSASGATGTIALTGLTNHALLVGAGTSTITKVGPTATAGQVLQSAGSSADPAFSTATYPATTTVSQILYSSATNVVSGLATANDGVLITSHTGVPSLLANGTTGQVLTATTGAPPSWATPGGVNPFSTVTYYDDFLGSVSTSATVSHFTFRTLVNGGAMTTTNGTADHPGILQLNTGVSATGEVCILSQPLGLLFGGGVTTYEAVVNIPTLSDGTETFTARFGFGDQGSGGGAIADGAWFEYTHSVNSGNWTINTSSNSSPTSANTSTAVGTGWVRLKVECNAAGTSMAFYVNGSQVTNSPITTTIPTGASRNFGVMASMLKSNGTTLRAANIDLIYLNIALTNTR